MSGRGEGMVGVSGRGEGMVGVSGRGEGMAQLSGRDGRVFSWGGYATSSILVKEI